MLVKSPNYFNDPKALFVFDTASVINLLISGYATEIISTVKGAFVLPEIVCCIIHQEEALKTTYSTQIVPLIKTNKLTIAPLTDNDESVFLSLVIGPNLESLADDEASAVAIAASTQGTLVTGEPKVHTVCAEKYPDIRLADFVDMLRFVHECATISEKDFGTLIKNIKEYAYINDSTFCTGGNRIG